MYIDEVLDHFDSKDEIAEAIGRTRQCIFNWVYADSIPYNAQILIEEVTGGILVADIGHIKLDDRKKAVTDRFAAQKREKKKAKKAKKKGAK